jgi:hypothetical protein
MAKVRTEVGLDERHWVTEDGHLHVSVPAEVPVKWRRKRDEDDPRLLAYISGPYEILHVAHGAKRIYWVYREETQLPMAFYSRLIDAQDRAVKNARGEDRMNVA